MSKFTNSPLVEYTRISPNKNEGKVTHILFIIFRLMYAI